MRRPATGLYPATSRRGRLYPLYMGSVIDQLRALVSNEGTFVQVVETDFSLDFVLLPGETKTKVIPKREYPYRLAEKTYSISDTNVLPSQIRVSSVIIGEDGIPHEVTEDQAINLVFGTPVSQKTIFLEPPCNLDGRSFTVTNTTHLPVTVTLSFNLLALAGK